MTFQESSKAQASVAAVVPLMLVLILTVLMIQLQGFSRLFLVPRVAPLGLIGVVAALLLRIKKPPAEATRGESLTRGE